MFLFKFVSLNVRDIDNFHKQRAIFTCCRKRRADIFLQETHSKGESKKRWMNEWGGKIFYSHGRQNSCGVALLIRNGFNCTVEKTIIDPLGHFIALKVDIEDKVYVFGKYLRPK